MSEKVSIRAPRRLPPAPARRIVAALALLAAALLPRALPAGERDVPEARADIELRRSDRKPARPGRPAPAGTRHPDATGARGRTGSPGASAAARLAARLPAAAAALGETLRSTGTLSLPGVDGRGILLDGEHHPVLEFGTGRRAIFDPGGELAPRLAAEISRQWPEYAVVRPDPQDDLRALLGGILGAAGYASVARSTPVSFGGAVTIRLVPDFVILKNDADLLEGETLLLSVVRPADALPPELRELAAEHRVRTVDVDGDGAPVGTDRAPWVDAAGRITTMEVRRPWLVLAEIASALGLSIERKVVPPPVGGATPPRVAARISGGRVSALLLAEPPDAEARAALSASGETLIVVSRSGDLPAAIRSLLERFGIAAIGPRVELYRPPPPASTRPRFTISVPGWLAESGGRRLLITGAGPQTLVKRFLGREGIDILEYRVREPEIGRRPDPPGAP